MCKLPHSYWHIWEAIICEQFQQNFNEGPITVIRVSLWLGLEMAQLLPFSIFITSSLADPCVGVFYCKMKHAGWCCCIGVPIKLQNKYPFCFAVIQKDDTGPRPCPEARQLNATRRNKIFALSNFSFSECCWQLIESVLQNFVSENITAVALIVNRTEENSSMELAVIWGNFSCSDLACSDLACSDLACSDLAHSNLAHSDLGYIFCQNSYFFSLNIHNLGTQHTPK